MKMAVYLVYANVIFLLIGLLKGTNQQVSITAWNQETINDRPIIGVLSQDYFEKGNNRTSNFSYIAASYVKFIESGGARAVPIQVLLPGGGQSLIDSQYAIVGKKIFDYATTANDQGNYFPIWATCLGFELIATLLVPNHDIITNCSAFNMPMALELSEGVANSRLFKDLPADVNQYLVNLPVTANFHRKCITPESVNSSGLSSLINVLSTNKDENNIEFVSTYEVLNYPFYAIQWHVEKNPYEWTTDPRWNNILHSPESVRVTQHFASFLASEARKNNQHFKNPKQEEVELIYNISPLYSGKNGSEFSEIYKFRVG